MKTQIVHEVRATAKITRADGSVEIVEIPATDIVAEVLLDEEG